MADPDDIKRWCVAHDDYAVKCAHIKHGELHDCGYIVDTFACKIRHQAIMTGNTEARKHDVELQKKWQEKHYGL